MTKTMSKVNIEDLTILYSELTRAYYIANPNNTSVKKEVTKEVEVLINKELEELKQETVSRQETENSLTKWVADLTEKLEIIEMLVDKKKFKTDDIELLRSSIIEVLERKEYEYE